jgi:hypothetical protein
MCTALVRMTVVGRVSLMWDSEHRGECLFTDNFQMDRKEYKLWSNLSRVICLATLDWMEMMKESRRDLTAVETE